jgi:hypothetical protein
MRKRLLLFGLLVVVLCVGGFVIWAQPATAITRENASRIQVGMTLDGEQKFMDTESIPVHRRSESPLDMLRRWLRL